MNKTLRLFILFSLILAAGGLVSADEPASSLDDKPSVDTAAVVGNRTPPVASTSGLTSTNASSASVPAAAAMVVPPANPDAQASYLYDLKKLIDKSRENIKRVNEKIKEQAVLKRNQKREERAREYYQKGVELSDAGKLDEAREYFEKAIRITEHPEMSGYIRESQQRLKRQENALHAQENERLGQVKEDEASRRREVEDAYKEAVALYKEKKFHPAKDAFEHVQEIVPDYRATASYLKIIDEDIIISDAVAAKQQKVEIERQQKEAEAARAKEKETWRREIEEKERQRKEQINKQAQEVYEQALALYQKKKFAEAKKKFQEVSWVVPDYKATMNYLRRIDQDAEEERQRVAREQEKALQEQRWQEEVARAKAEALKKRELEVKEQEHRKQLEDQAKFLYQAAVKLFDNKAMDEALEKFGDIEKTCPDFKSTRLYIARIKQWQIDERKHREEEEIRKQQQADQQKKRLRDEEVNRIYQPALAYYKASDFEKAKEGFLKVNEKMADYKNTQKYLNDIENKAYQAQLVYQAAVALFENKVMDEALGKFNDVQKIYPNFKSTKTYIDTIVQWRTQKERQEDQEKRQLEQRRQLETQVSGIYIKALKNYKAQNLAEARKGFIQVYEKMPDYEFTRKYLTELGVNVSELAPLVAPQPVPVVPAPAVGVPSVPNPVPVKEKPSALSLEDQQKQARDIAALALKSSQLYRQIAGIADDKHTIATKKKMAQVDAIINNIKQQQDRLLKQMHQELWFRQQQETRAQQEARRAEAQKKYEEAVDLLRSQQAAKAKTKFLELENMYPDYKATRSYLNRIRQDESHADLESVTQQEESQTKRMQQMQQKEKAEAMLKAKKDQEEQQLIEQKQNERLGALAQKASDINDDIIRLSKEKNYEAMKTKFTELENTVQALTALKDAMAKQKDRRQRERQLDQEDIHQRHQQITAEKQREGELPAYTKAPAKEKQPQPPQQPDHADVYKRRELTREQALLYSEAVDCYEHKKYTQARLLFGELADQHDRRSEVWLKKVDRAISLQLLRAKQAEEREHTAFIADQLRSQRRLILIQEQERQRQKKLTAELEIQKRLNEQKILQERQKQETMKAQEKERQRLEEGRRKLEKESENQQQAYRFHKVLEAKSAASPATIAKPAALPTAADLEKKHKEELLRRMAEDRAEKIKQAQIVRDETKRRAELARHERLSQSQLNAQRESMRKQLEDGVEAMYQEALRCYKQGKYTAAADKFKDVQDILPGYKDSSQYMDDARKKAQPETSPSSLGTSNPPLDASSAARQDAISKTLDLFDPNVK